MQRGDEALDGGSSGDAGGRRRGAPATHDAPLRG